MHGRFEGVVVAGDSTVYAYDAAWSVGGTRNSLVVWSAHLRRESEARLAHEIEGRFPLGAALLPGMLPATEAGRCAIAQTVRAMVELGAVQAPWLAVANRADVRATAR